MRNKREWDESQSGQWKYFLENEKKEKKNQDFKKRYDLTWLFSEKELQYKCSLNKWGMFPKQPHMGLQSHWEFVMRNETVDEFLKRGGKIKHLDETVGARVLSARESVTKRTVNTFSVMVPELRDWAAREGIII